MCVCVYGGGDMAHSKHEVREQLNGVSSLLPSLFGFHVTQVIRFVQLACSKSYCSSVVS